MTVEMLPAYDHQEEIKELFTEYTEDIIACDSSFREYLAIQNYDEEVQHLEMKYGMPEGRVYIVYCDGEAVGCAALKKLTEDSCEIKRIYVRENYRDRHIGSFILKRLISDAREIGYAHILLDTFPFLERAIEMYKRYGFYFIDKYNNSPMDITLFMQYDL